MPMTNTTLNKRNHGVDALRGLAILSVILLHVNIRVPFSDTFIGGLMPKYLYGIVFWSGYYGVCMFFVISGFLITSTSLKRWKSLPGLSLKGFYEMRFARIIPLLAALLLVLALLHFGGVSGYKIPDKTSIGSTLFAALTFHINLLEIKVGYLPASWDILWSLSIEEFFYFFFPIALFFCRKEWHFIAFVSIFLIISPFARTVWYPGNELGDRNYFAYLDAIALGCIAAIISKRINIKKNSLIVIGIAGVLMCSLILFFRHYAFVLKLPQTGLNVTVLAVGTALVLIWMQKRLDEGKQTMSKFTGPLRFLGRNSYEIYLTHMFAVTFLVVEYKTLNLSGEWSWLLYALSIVVSGLLGGLVARYLSNPANAYIRNKFKAVSTKRGDNGAESSSTGK